ncbi:hypothetical protein THARTR1_01870 [Trichoderma harzianum]|uniref:Uncharacterized protein n=1 Tax=Trichoderma harzianum TaxID=5544 RepID=A0A2K0UKS2_TRIHA|nr:hypothetical protein THARTR1_01870 [Trichoderma harzianum]
MKTPTLAILAALGSLQAVAAQVIPGRMIWVDAATCDPWAKSNGFPSAAGPGGLLTSAFDIIDKMAIASSYRIYHPTTQSPTALPANVLAWERYRVGPWAFLTLHSPFLASIMYGDLGLTPHFSLWSAMMPPDPYHRLPVELTGKRIETDGITTPCATNGQSGYSYDNNQKFYQNIIYCTKNMKLPMGFTSKGPTAFASGTTLDVAGKTWLGALYTQVLWNGGGVGIFGDYSLAYGYAAAHAMRNNRDSVFNPDSHKFYSFAQMFDNLFWGSGVGQTSQQEYASLQKTAAGKAIIATFGLTNIAVPARGINWASASGWIPPSLMNDDSPKIPPIPTS